MLDEIIGYVKEEQSASTSQSDETFSLAPALRSRPEGEKSSDKSFIGLLDDATAHSTSEVPASSFMGMLDTFTSPLFSYFFSAETLATAPDAYLTYLEALRAIRTKLREYQPDETPTVQTFLEFIRLHRQLGSTITSVRSKSDRIDDAVNLMTAHKSKGLEFDNVYVIGAIDSSWGERVRSRSRLINYPENLQLAPTGDSLDERLRLFFVAMTRAKKQLTISYASGDEGGKTTLRASFLTDESWQADTPPVASTIASLTRAAELLWYEPVIKPLQQTMRELLAPTLERYKLSSTHLNNFLDVTRGGPQLFLMSNLLRFPQAMGPSAGYGSAIHATLQRTHAHLTATGKHRPIEDILHDFEENLHDQHMSDKDFQTYLQKGSEALSAFLEEKYITFTRSQKVELSFSNQNVFLGEAHLTGSLDLVDFNDDKTVVVTDYKTGKAVRSWTGKTDYEKIKLHKYKQQLMFYNLLIANSRDYRNHSFERGVLQFVEPTPGGDIVAIDATFTHDDLARFSRLIQSVWRHITTLDLPDTSSYEPNYKGMLEFEQALLDE
jgi:DNA helicase-2/ATP-dependent DNA helicase PcrA